MKRFAVCLVVSLLVASLFVCTPNALANWTGGHDVVGAPQAKKTWYFAEGCTRTNFNTWLCLYNPALEVAGVSITYYLETGETKNHSITIPVSTRSTVDVNSTCGWEHDVSIKVESSSPIVAERSVYFDNNGYNGGHVAMGAEAPQQNWYFAEGATQAGFQEWLCILNPNWYPVTTQAIYFVEGISSPVSENLVIQGHTRYTRHVADVVGPDKNVSVSVRGINPDQTTVCERPMYFNYKGQWNGGHNAMGANNLSNKWLFAEGCTRDGFDTWLTLQNPNVDSTTVTTTYMLGTGENIIKTHEISPNTRRTIYVADEIGKEQDVSIKVESTKPIAVERPMYFNYHGKWDGGSDSFGIPETHTVSMFAEGCSRSGFETWLCIQNPNDRPVTANINYKREDGIGTPQDIVVPANTRVTIDANKVVGAEHDFSTIVQSDLGLVVERPMYFDYQGKAPPPPSYIYDFSGESKDEETTPYYWTSPAIGLQQGITTFDYSIRATSIYPDISGLLDMSLLDEAGNKVSYVTTMAGDRGYGNTYTQKYSRCIGVPTAGNYFLKVWASYGNWSVHIEQPRPTSAPPMPVSFSGSGNKHTEFFSLEGGIYRFGMGGKSGMTITIYKSTGEYAVLPASGYGVLLEVNQGIYIIDVACASSSDYWVVSGVLQ